MDDPATPARPYTDRRKWCQRCGNLDDVRIFSASGGELSSAKAWLCKSCTSQLWPLLRLFVANQPITMEPAAITSIPPLPDFPDDSGEKPLFREGERVIPAGRDDPRMPDWVGGADLAPEPATVEKVRRWGSGTRMDDIDDLWVYSLRTSAGAFVGVHTAYQLLRTSEPGQP